MVLNILRGKCFIVNVVSVTAIAFAARVSALTDRPNFIVIQPDDHLFLEEWNPPGRFHLQEGIAEIATSTISPSSLGTTTSTIYSASTTEYMSPVPNINRIRNYGLDMTNAYAASTMCGTSRYSTLTGRLPSRSSYGRSTDKDRYEGDESSLFLRNVNIPRTKLEDAEGVEDARDCTSNNLAAVLQNHGYYTGVVGKWHLDADTGGVNGLYDNYPQVQKEVKRCGFDFAEAIYRENLGGGRNFNVDGDPVTHNMEHLTSEAIRFIQESIGSSQGENEKGNNKQDEEATNTSNNGSSEKKPFFLYFNPTVPHHSGDVIDALMNGSCRDTVQGKLSKSPNIPYGMTSNIDAGGDAGCRKYRKSVLERAAIAAASMGTSSEVLDQKLAGAVWVDDAIGSIFETLEALDILNNTLILFQLDHGLDAKGSLFEGGSRIVQFVHYPDRIKVTRDSGSLESTQYQRGWQFEGLVSTIDIAPTLMDLAGVPSTPTNSNGSDEPVQHRYNMDGKSWIADVVARNTVKDEEVALKQEKVYGSNYFEERCLFVEEGLDRSVRCGCYKYIFISDPERGFTVRDAYEEGLDLDTHNFYYLCDEFTGQYVNSPERSPELWSILPDSPSANRNQISNDLKTKLKGKIACLLKKTNPSEKFPDYKTDCDLPLYDDKLGTPSEENNLSSDGSPVNNVTEDIELNDSPMTNNTPSESPDNDSLMALESNRPTIDEVTMHDGFVHNDSDPEAFGIEGDTPFLKSPSPESSSSLVDTIPTYAIVIAAIILLVAPCLIYWMYREACRRVVVGAKADCYRSRMNQEILLKDLVPGTKIVYDYATTSKKQNERKLLQSTKIHKFDLETGSAVVHKAGYRVAKEFEKFCAKSYHPSFWQKLADEAKRQAFLRAKWNIYTLSDVVAETSSSTIGTALTSTTTELISGTLIEGNHHTLLDNSIRAATETCEGNQTEILKSSDVEEEDDISILEEVPNEEEIINLEECDDGDVIQISDNETIDQVKQGERLEEGNNVAEIDVAEIDVVRNATYESEGRMEGGTESTKGDDII